MYGLEEHLEIYMYICGKCKINFILLGTKLVQLTVLTVCKKSLGYLSGQPFKVRCLLSGVIYEHKDPTVLYCINAV